MKKRWLILSIVIVLLFLIAFLFTRFTGFVVTGTGVNTCYDSDFGKNYWERGEVSGDYYLEEKQFFLIEDECEEDILHEYYCVTDQTGIHSYNAKQIYKCPEGCLDGKCLGKPKEVPHQSSLDRFIDYITIGRRLQ